MVGSIWPLQDTSEDPSIVTCQPTIQFELSGNSSNPQQIALSQFIIALFIKAQQSVERSQVVLGNYGLDKTESNNEHWLLIGQGSIPSLLSGNSFSSPNGSTYGNIINGTGTTTSGIQATRAIRVVFEIQSQSSLMPSISVDMDMFCEQVCLLFVCVSVC